MENEGRAAVISGRRSDFLSAITKRMKAICQMIRDDAISRL